MSLAYFLARRIHFSQEDENQRVSPPAIRIAIAGIAIGLAVMILSVAIVVGFKQEIREKAIGFGAHMQIQALTANTTYETLPITISDSILLTIQAQKDVQSVQPFATKPAIFKTEEDFLSAAIKGLGADADRSFFERHLVEGKLPECEEWGNAESLASREVVISRIIAEKLRLQVGDDLPTYFIKSDQNNEFALGSEKNSVRSRRLQVVGIYETHFEEYDSQIVLGDLQLLQEVSGWNRNQASGIEIRLKDFDRLQNAFLIIYNVIAPIADREGDNYYLRTIEQINPQIFSWLELLDTNVWIILALIAAVAAFTMISGLLIIILERTQMIGILKALGYDNGELRKLFIYVATFLIGKGLLWGNIIGITLCLIQLWWHPITLDPQNYYMQWVPIALNPWHIIGLNLATIFITLLVLLGPSAIVAKISPSKVMLTE